MAEDRPATLEEVITGLAKQSGVSPSLALAVAQKESSLDLNAPMGTSGEKGVFQLLPDTAKALGVNPDDPLQNITGGIKYLNQLNTRFGGDVQKVLQGYNGGPEHVDAGTVSPQAQAYASEVLANLSKGLRTKATAPLAVQNPIGAPQGPEQPPPKTRAEFVQQQAARMGVSQYTIPLSDVASGFAKGVGQRVTRLGEMLRNRFPSLAVGPEVQVPIEPTSTGERIGVGLERVGEFALPGAVGKVIGLTGKAALAAETAGVYGVAKSQEDPHAGVTALLSAVPGLAALRGGMAQTAQRAWQAGAEESMTKILESAATAKNEKQVEKAAAAVLPLALDRSLLRTTQGEWAKAVDVARKAAKSEVGTVLASGVGDEPLPIAPVIQELEGLKNRAIAYTPSNATTPAQVQAGIGGAIGSGAGVTATAIEPPVVKLIDNMQKKLTTAAGPTGLIQARELVKFRQNWDRFVYKAKPFLDPTARTQFKKEAYLAGADSIRRVIATEPAVDVLAKVNQAVHQHEQLYSLINDVGFGSPTLPMAFGWKKIVVKKLLQAAVKSPSWRLASVQTKLAIGDAVASGAVDSLRRLTGPIIASAVVGSPEAEPSPAPAPQ